MDTRSIGDMGPIYSRMVPESEGKVQSVIPFYYRGEKHLCLLSDYGRDGALESAKATLVVKRGRSDDRIDVEMILDRDGLMSMHLDAGDPSMAEDMDGIAESLFDSIIGLYHTHAHPRGENVIGFYKGEDRSEALEWICGAYERRLIDDVTNYRNNPKEPGVFFDIKSCALYARSFLDKYGNCLGDGKDYLEYICRYAEESADHTYLSREYKMNHGATENMASMNNRMFVLMMLSIAMSFFAGSVFNEAIGGMSRSVWAIAGAVAFIATGYFGLRYARKRSEKEKDGLYKE